MTELYSITHEVKIHSCFYDRILSGQKRFEIRKNDRDYQIGDWMHLVDGSRKLAVKIIYISDFEQKDGYVVIGFTVGDPQQ